jgi:hypothetical protein
MKDLVAFGFVQEAFSYCEEVSKQLINFKKNSHGRLESLKWAILQISERLQRCEDSEVIGGLNWIQDLKVSLGDSVEVGTRKSSLSSIEQVPDTHVAPNSTVTPYYPEEVQSVLPNDMPDYNPVTHDTAPSYYDPTTATASLVNSNQFSREPSNSIPIWNSNPYETDQWNGGNIQNQTPNVPEPNDPPSSMKSNPTFSSGNNNMYFTPANVTQGATPYGQQQHLQPMSLGNGPVHPSYGPSTPSNDPGHQNTTYFPNKIPDQQQQPQPSEHTQQKKEPKPKPKEAEKKSENKSGGFFGSMFGKWIKEDKTQMKLPDDKNPSIVWDDVKKKWVNVGGDAEEENTAAAAPPSDMLLMKMQQSSNPPTSAPAQNLYQQMPLITNNAPPPNNNNSINSSMRMMPTGIDPSQVPQGPASLNKYSLPKGRPLKNSYVDVLKPSGIPTGPMPQLPPMFTPAPLDIGDTGPASFVTPSPDVSQGYMPSASDGQTQDSTQSQPMFDHSSFQQGQMYGYGQPNPQ